MSYNRDTEDFKRENYIRKILSENKNLYTREIPLIMKAFTRTLLYFVNNALEFSIKDMFSFSKHHKKATRMYVRYRDEFDDIPAYDTYTFKIDKKLKDYLNFRREFTEANHKQFLPDGEIRVKKIG